MKLLDGLPLRAKTDRMTNSKIPFRICCCVFSKLTTVDILRFMAQIYA